MGAVIEAVRTSAPEGRDSAASSVALAAGAVRAALGASGRALVDVGLLINTGVYRDDHTCEPAMAPLIHRAVGGATRESARPASGLFAFDLANGAGGMLSAFFAADGLLRARSMDFALIVGSDVDPTPAISDGCAFEPLGAAVLLGSGTPDTGFGTFGFDTYSKHSKLFESRLNWVDADEPRGNGGESLRFDVREGDEYLRRCVDCAAVSLERFVASRGYDVADIDLIATSQYPAGFSERFAEAVGIPSERVARGRDGSYTAGLAAGLATAVEDGRFGAARRTVFVAASAGITISLADYRSGIG